MERNFEFEDFCRNQIKTLGGSMLGVNLLYFAELTSEGGVYFLKKETNEWCYPVLSENITYLKQRATSILLEELENLYVHKTPIHKNVQ